MARVVLEDSRGVPVDYPCTAMLPGDIGVITENRSDPSMLGKLVISGSGQLIFPQSGVWSSETKSYRYRKLRPEERVIFSES